MKKFDTYDRRPRPVSNGVKTITNLKKIKKPVYVALGVNIDFFELFQKIEREFDTCFIFESLGEEGKFSRYSIIGFDPQHVIAGRGESLVLDGKKFPVKNPYFALRDCIPTHALSRNYAGGLVGYLGYDAVNYMEPAVHVKEHPQFDQFLFGAYTDGLILDKLTNELSYFFYDVDRSTALRKIMKKRLPKGDFSAEIIDNGLSKKEHAKIVQSVKGRIYAGDTFQCEVGYKTTYKVSGNLIFLYGRLRNVNPSPFMYFMKFKKSILVGASPELLFSLRDGEMATRPLAGTIRRGKDEKEDQQLARSLINDPKERAEHNMLVDLHRNDMGRVAKFGTVKIRELMSVKKFSHVQHISSEVSGTIRDGEDMFSALASNFPMGTVTGTPKIETMKIIDENEPEARGPYGGGVGHFGFNGDCTFALSLRSMYISGSKAYTQTSGGIVHDSTPEKEYEEIRNKSAAMKKAIGI